MTITSVVAFASIFILQDAPQDIAKGDLPKKGHCVVCEADGSDHGMEGVAAGVKYKGKSYFFCNKNEIAVFKKDPESFMPPVLPRPMPAFDMKDLSGTAWNLESMKSKTVLIDFWATWCGPCKEMKPVVDMVRTKTGIEVLSVSVDEKRADLDKFLIKNKFKNPVLHDTTQTFATWKVRSIPSFFVVKNGQVVAQWVGKKSEKDMLAILAKHK
jgi:thiol-disulfide isomerase/thioredoxin